MIFPYDTRWRRSDRPEDRNEYFLYIRQFRRGVTTDLFVQRPASRPSARDPCVIVFDALNYAVISSLDGCQWKRTILAVIIDEKKYANIIRRINITNHRLFEHLAILHYHTNRWFPKLNGTKTRITLLARANKLIWFRNIIRSSRYTYIVNKRWKKLCVSVRSH